MSEQERIDEVVRLWNMQSDSMKTAVINVMKATVGEYKEDEDKEDEFVKSRSVARRTAIQKGGE